MACNDVRSLISAVLDRRATPEERSRVAAHIAECVACRAEVRELEAVDAALKTLPAPQPPEGYHESFVSRLTMTIDDQDQDAAKEKEKAGPKEDSGLLEIRKMASRDITAQREAVRKREEDDAVAAVSAVNIPASVSQPHVVVPPKPAQEPRRGWVVPVAAVGGLVVVAGVVFAMLQGGAKRELVRGADPGAAPPPVPAAFDPSAPGPASAPAASQPTVAAAGPAVAMAPNEAPPAKAAAMEHGDKEKPARAAKAEHEGAARRESREPKEAKPAKEPTAAPPAAAGAREKDLTAVPATKAPAKGKADQLDELLGSGPKKEEKKAEPGEDLPDTLNPDQIKSGMSSVKGRVMGCYDKYDVAGVARLSVTIGKAGKITHATVTGEFAGTPTGECVSAAVKTASFPRFKGKPLSINYSYLLKR
jgi:hypothetical protein